MRYELIKRGRIPSGIETMYRSSLSLEDTDDLQLVQQLFAEDLRTALEIKNTTGLSLHVLVDLAEEVYVADILEKDEQKINTLPKSVITNP